MIAHFEEHPADSERRRSARRSLKLGAVGDGTAVTVHDISLTGLLMESPAPMLVGASFEVELPHAGAVPAVVVWNSGEFYGCEFHEPVSPAAVSAALLQSDPENRTPKEKHDPLRELRDLTEQVEQIASKLDRVIDRLSGTPGDPVRKSDEDA